MTAGSRAAADDDLTNRSRWNWISAFGIFVLTAATLLATSRPLPWTWDEPDAVTRAARLTEWLGLWFDSESAAGRPCDPQAIARFVPYTTQREGHPAFYGLVIAVGRRVAPAWLADKEAWRFGPILFFSVAVAAVAHQLQVRVSPGCGWLFAGLLLTSPRLFSHAHLATCDGPLTAGWMLSWAVFRWGRRSWLGSLVWGVLLGLTMSCKFTGWLAPVGFLLWCALWGNAMQLVRCLCGCLVAQLTFVLVNPPLWTNTATGLAQFLDLNLHRAAAGLDISTLFFGQVYDAGHPLPWYNSLAWTVLVTPPLTLLLAVGGFWYTARNRSTRPVELELVCLWCVLIFVKALPWVPGHDAERLFLPSFACLAALAASGGARLATWAKECRSVARRRWAAASLVVVVGAGAAENAWYAPQWLSYYSPLVGGLREAARLGLEPTYYWDGWDQHVWNWLKEHVERDATVACQASATFVRFVSSEQSPEFQLVEWLNPEADWWVVQNRPGNMPPLAAALVAEGHPAFVQSIRQPHQGWGPWRLDVPVVLIYSNSEVRRVSSALARSSSSARDAHR